MANFIISVSVVVLIMMKGYLTNGVEELFSDTSVQESRESDFERFPRHNQNQHGTTSHDDSIPFANDSPGNYFMDLYSIQTGPKQVEFGHVYENPDTWEQRYEKKDHENKRFQGQVFKEGSYDIGYRRGNEQHMKEYHEVTNPKTGHFKIMARWGDKNGGYGEQYWDYNHGSPNENEELPGESNEETSLSVRSPSVNPSPSIYNSVNQPMKLTRDMPSPTIHSKPKKPKKSKKRYEEPPRRHSFRISESSSTNKNFFVLPRSMNPMTADKQTDARQMDISDDGPLRFHLYEQPNMLTQANEHVLQITTSTSRSRARIIRP